MVLRKGQLTEEQRKHFSEAIRLQHKINPNYGMKGKKHLDKTKEKISLASKGKSKSKEHKKNWLEAMTRLRKEGKLKAWNKGFSIIKGKYPNSRYQTHKAYTSQPFNFYRIPKGMIVHHLDLNPLNNNPNNLIMLDISSHHKLHGKIWGMMR